MELAGIVVSTRLGITLKNPRRLAVASGKRDRAHRHLVFALGKLDLRQPQVEVDLPAGAGHQEVGANQRAERALLGRELGKRAFVLIAEDLPLEL